MAISNRRHYSQPFSIQIIHRVFTGKVTLPLQFKALTKFI